MAQIGIVSATGIVGIELLKILIKHGYPNLRICASDKSIGTIIKFDSDEYEYNEYQMIQLNKDFFDGLKIAFFCSNNDVSKKWIPIAIQEGVTVIDNSSEFRLNRDIPLIVPEINGNILLSNEHKLIANPNCSAAILCMILYPLTKLGMIKRVDVSTYQAVSGAGKAGIDELVNQIDEYVLKPSLPLTCITFKSPILDRKSVV